MENLMSAAKTVTDWIRDDNVCQFLDVLGWLVKHDFAYSEWEAIRSALENTDAGKGKWHECEFRGAQALKFRLAAEPGANKCHVAVEAPELLVSGVETAILLAQSYHLDK
jgi:hypothetical protein